jgi:hypothetical protein
MKEWKFEQPGNTAVIADRFFAEGTEICVYVTHDAYDDGWQFLTANTNGDERRAVVLALSTVVELDPTLDELADLPPGWYATRQSKDERWSRHKKIEK